ncbi:MAG: iron ABC transporter permease [Chloroflexales bacterium]|nr:iron ABC transporter permease [Chloroflexales bacterium]
MTGDSLPSIDRAQARASRQQLARFNRMRHQWVQPTALLGLLLLLILGAMVVMPLIYLVATTAQGFGFAVWQQVLLSDLAPNLFWRPLVDTLAIGMWVALGTVILGGYLAWLVVMTDVPGRAFIGLLASIPFALPSFALALAWEIIFRNGRIGGQTGLLFSFGINVPDWLAWGYVPIVLTLVAHYFSLAFLLISAALASVNTELLEAAEMTGASRVRILRDITLPVVSPAILSSGLLAFAEGVSNFASPALLGLPVRFHTISTRLYGAIQTGQTERGFVLTILLIVIAAAVLWGSTRVVNSRRSFTTITGKGARRRRQRLGAWRWPAFGVGLAICLATTIIPGLALLFSSFTKRTGSLSGGLTTHYWIGGSEPTFAQGQPGIFSNPNILQATGNTFLLGLSVALVATLLGLMMGYVVVRGRNRLISSTVGLLSYIPFLIPGVALGAVYIAQFGRPIGPLPALYGSFALLVIAGAAATLPFAAQSGRSAMSQVAGELEEAATMAGANFIRRLGRIFLPLTIRGLLAGAVLVFVNMARDLSLVVLLVTPTTPLLSVLAFQYASEGFAQFAYAITIIIAVISVTATMLARRAQGLAQPWNER